MDVKVIQLVEKLMPSIVSEPRSDEGDTKTLVDYEDFRQQWLAVPTTKYSTTKNNNDEAIKEVLDLCGAYLSELAEYQKDGCVPSVQQYQELRDVIKCGRDEAVVGHLQEIMTHYRTTSEQTTPTSECYVLGVENCYMNIGTLDDCVRTRIKSCSQQKWLNSLSENYLTDVECNRITSQLCLKRFENENRNVIGFRNGVVYNLQTGWCVQNEFTENVYYVDETFPLELAYEQNWYDISVPGLDEWVRCNFATEDIRGWFYVFLGYLLNDDETKHWNMKVNFCCTNLQLMEPLVWLFKQLFGKDIAYFENLAPTCRLSISGETEKIGHRGHAVRTATVSKSPVESSVNFSIITPLTAKVNIARFLLKTNRAYLECASQITTTENLEVILPRNIFSGYTIKY